MDEHTLNDLLECSVCLERLDTSSKVLPCQHTFCRKCLEVIVSSHNELRCPECRIVVNVKIDHLPPNVLLMRILEGMKQTQQQQLKIDARKDMPMSKCDQRVYQSPENQHAELTHHHQPQPQQQLPNVPQQRRVPHAYAIFDFESNEGADLKFKKSDLILLKRKIDKNWYVGSLNGVEGTFPINYVQVIEPLPAPQCVALYDFKMGPQEEEGCLTFKKGTLIHVLRRVDQNWAEGCIGTNIGIFPIAFVELNLSAKQLLENLAETVNAAQPTVESEPMQQPQQSFSNLPAIPTSNVENSGNPSNNMSNTSSLPPAMLTTTNFPINSNANISSPTHSERMAPISPQHIGSGSASVRHRDNREKRHSLNTLLCASGVSSNLSNMKSNRHSAEILSIPSELTTSTANASVSSGEQSTGRMIAPSTGSELMPTPAIAHNSQTQQSQQRINVLKTSPQNMPTSLPWGYFALYPYKPRKSDELELKKGCVYIVTERCLDGWYKGKNWQNTSGVFPGNYVAPLRERDQQQLMHQLKYVPPQSQSTLMPVPSTTQITAPQLMSTTNIAEPLASNFSNHPPDLPPRHTLGNFAAYKSVWTKPLNQTVEAFFNRQSSSKADKAHGNMASEKEAKTQKDSASATGTTTTCSSSAVSLMKRLTNIKARSKSPNVAVPPPAICGVNATNNLMDNLTVQDGSSDTTTTNSQPNKLAHVHVRSGSCPSQLLQNHPNELNCLQLTDPQQGSPQCTYGSKRVKANKERPAPQLQQSGTRHPVEIHLRSAAQLNIGLPPPPPLPLAHQEQNPTVSTKCGQHQQQMHQQSQTHPHQHIQQQNPQPVHAVENVNQFYHRKSQSLDASALIAPTQHITAAAIAASATTKSTQCTRESRFRCVVPYPPNSEIELELHVGDIIYVQRKQKNGWYKGTHARTNKTGLFPASFVEPDL